MTGVLVTLYLLVIAHIVIDFPLQGDFMSNAKNRNKTKYPDVPWYIVLIAHGMLHGAGVFFVTRNPILGLCESVAHTVIDFFKCEEKYSFSTDQQLHILCKLIWLIITFSGGI